MVKHSKAQLSRAKFAQGIPAMFYEIYNIMSIVYIAWIALGLIQWYSPEKGRLLFRLFRLCYNYIYY